MRFDTRTVLTSAASGLAMLAALGAATAQTSSGGSPLAIERQPPIGTQPTVPAPVLVPQTSGPPMSTQPPVPPAPLVVPPGPPPIAVPDPVKPGPVFVPETPKIQGSSAPAPAAPQPATEKPAEPAAPSSEPPRTATPETAPAAAAPSVTAPGATGAGSPPAAPTPETAKPVEPAPQPLIEDVDLVPRPVLFVTGVTTWEQAEEKLGAVFASLAQAAKKLGIADHGAPLVEYIESDSDDVGFRAMLPVSALPKGKLPRGIKAGQSPGGKALKFRHNGPLDDLEEVYGRIDDELAKRGADAKTILEQYDEDALASPEDRVVVDVYVFVK